MESVVDQALRQVHGLDTFFRLQLVAENDFMHGRRVVGQIVSAFEPFADVVRVEHGIFGGLTQSVGTIGKNVSQGANEHSEISVEGANAAYRLRTVVFEAESAIGLGDDDRRGQERFENFLDGDRAGARTASTMRSGKSLV